MFPGYSPPKNELSLLFLLVESLRLVLKQPKAATYGHDLMRTAAFTG